jgi:uncharacterized protein (DUF3820 family)
VEYVEITMQNTMPMGKYIGTAVKELIKSNPNYVLWMYGNGTKFNDEVIKEAEKNARDFNCS